MYLLSKTANCRFIQFGQFQNLVVSCILFCCPGIYLAVTGLGAGGGHPSTFHLADVTNTLLYALYALFGWLGGPLLKLLGPRWALAVGATGYPMYIGGLWFYDRTGKQGFPIFTGAYLGVAAGLLWSATAYVGLAYSCQHQKSLFVSTQWTILALGSTVGSLIAFGLNYHSKSTGVPEAVYIIFIIIMFMAVLLATFFVKDPSSVKKSDGSFALPPSQVILVEELRGLIAAAKDWRLLVLLPSAFISQSTVAWQSHLNSYYFSLRTRSLNNVLYWSIQLFLPYLFTAVLDAKRFPRRKRGLIGLSIQAIILIVSFSGELAWILKNKIDLTNTSPSLDWTDHGYGKAIVLYLLMGVQYCSSVVSVQWCVSLLVNNPTMYASYAGLYKGTQAAGMCVSFGIDAGGVSFKNQAIIYLVFMIVLSFSQLSITAVYGKESSVTEEEPLESPIVIEGSDIPLNMSSYESEKKENLESSL
ncbi:membrane transporter [Schizosaccharomyces cryophilus OY26]|uniref:Membrane transporter n=1 Tax=Schizosaccharomyces cryophilus (strain OY26 / ATCC MYA-4695 / CBS 11777 / NBRC 106824 / NRRL Y48691) TaxID=653667 RepID=S9X7T1_SCHCR|nr:membrane transporter [Schizosaccharomyces cryophilus OY26]EPY53197.1 membrane transporter [Schizosaccharomyces cryophilus OY26]